VTSAAQPVTCGAALETPFLWGPSFFVSGGDLVIEDSNMNNGHDADPEKVVQHRAYAIWEHEGRPDGRHLEHWQQALTQIEREKEAPNTLADAAPGGAVPVPARANKKA
jgi:Protein of unknown function (DUF2934)